MADQITIALRKALGKLAAQKTHLDGRISAIEAALGALGGSPRAKAARSRKGMSVAARKAIGKRMRAYWAKRRADAAKGKPKGSK